MFNSLNILFSSLQSGFVEPNIGMLETPIRLYQLRQMSVGVLGIELDSSSRCLESDGVTRWILIPDHPIERIFSICSIAKLSS